jgi:hypothetical protein
MSVGRAGPNAYQRLKAAGPNAPRRSPFPHPSSQYCDIPADFSKVDSILKHLQQTESHDWLGEVTHCCTQVCYLLLQNYNISRFNFYNYNCHLIVLTTLFLAQRIWFFLWRVTSFSDAHGLRFACHIVLFLVLLDSLYCGMQLVLKDSFMGSMYLATPLMSSVIFYQINLRTNTNVFTAELFSMLSRCVYHSLETAYCIGVLPLKFLQYEYIYFDTSRCMVLTVFVTFHIFLSFFCLELHCLGSEVLQQARMLGEWRWIPDLTRLKNVSPKPAEWKYDNCPYPRGAVVRCKGRYYEAMATMNTCSPTSFTHLISPVAFVLGDSQRTKALVLAALLLLNATLVHFILWSNQWSMYAVMLIPNCGHFLYVKYRRSHSFFNPAHLNLRQLQWDLSLEAPQHRPNGAGAASPNSGLSVHHLNGRAAHGDASGSWGGYPDEVDGDEASNHPDDADAGYGGGNHHSGDALAFSGAGLGNFHPNPLFMSAVTASTAFFFGPSSAAPSEQPPQGHSRNEGH